SLAGALGPPLRRREGEDRPIARAPERLPLPRPRASGRSDDRALLARRRALRPRSRRGGGPRAHDHGTPLELTAAQRESWNHTAAEYGLELEDFLREVLTPLRTVVVPT